MTMNVVIAQIRAGTKITAVKEFRQYFGPMDLLTAKRAVEAIQDAILAEPVTPSEPAYKKFMVTCVTDHYKDWHHYYSTRQEASNAAISLAKDGYTKVQVCAVLSIVKIKPPVPVEPEWSVEPYSHEIDYYL